MQLSLRLVGIKNMVLLRMPRDAAHRPLSLPKVCSLHNGSMLDD
jgi:hypothetical protein